MAGNEVNTLHSCSIFVNSHRNVAHRSLENKKAVAKELQVKAMQVAREIPADIAEEFRMVTSALTRLNLIHNY